MQDLAEYLHHETENNRLQSRKNTRKIRSTAGNKTRRNSTQLFSRHIKRERLDGLSSVHESEEITELSVLDLLLTYDCFVLYLLLKTREKIGTVTIVNEEETFL